MPIKIMIAAIIIEKNPDFMLIHYIKAAMNIIRSNGEVEIILPY
jgi:hypothetical protein